jgi:hypothetical protein
MSRTRRPFTRNCCSSRAPGAGIVSPRLGLALLLGLASSCTVQDEAIDWGADLDADSSTDLGHASFALAQTSLEQCVQDHVESAGGDPRAVRTLSCPVATPSACSGVPSPNLAGVSALTELRQLDLTGRCVADLTPIAALARLERLELANNAVSNLFPLGALKKLAYLGLADNPYEQEFGTSRREPFSELPELRELVLDGTDIGNVLPLSHARRLEKLSLRRAPALNNLQSLAALRGLRSLHIDEMFVSNLAALAEMTQLEELSANGTFVSSIEPLRALVARHRLRQVSLRGTCVSSCDALSPATHDCSEPREPSDCAPPEEVMGFFGPQLAVPLPMIERFASNDLPIWTSDELARGFAAAKQAPNIDWRNAFSNCDGRALLTVELLRDAGFPEVTQVVSYGNLRPLSADSPFGFYSFVYHIAVAVRAQAGVGARFFVIDPALDPEQPMTLDAWFARQVDSAGSSFDFSCEPYDQRYPIGSCATRVDADGSFLLDTTSLLRGAVCPDASCRAL